MIRLHGTCVDLGGAGVLLRGRPGAGKSDLGLRLIDAGARLVADDQVEVSPDGGRLTARAPERLFGFVEVRGVGILRVPAVRETRLVLVADLVHPAEIERLPEPETEVLAGIAIARLRIAPFEASAAAKLRFAAAALERGEPLVP